MALSRSAKTEKVKKLASELETSTSAIIGTFAGLTASKDFELRKAVRGVGAHYQVIKNRIAEKAAEGGPASELLKELKGMCSIAYTSGDPVALAKALTVYAKANPSFTFRAGLVEGRVVDVSGITQLSSLPSKEELFSKLLYVINAPAQQLVTAMNGVGRNLAVVIDQGVKENKFNG